MDLEDSTYILKNILSSEVDQASARNRLWTKKLTCVSTADAQLSGKIAKEIAHTLSKRPFVLLVPRDSTSVALYTEAQLLKRGIVRLQVPGLFSYYATSNLPEELLFRKKKQKKAQATENAAQIIDLRAAGWLELLPFEVRFISGKLVIRAARYLEELRLVTEKDILRIGNPEEWKRASIKTKAPKKAKVSKKTKVPKEATKIVTRTSLDYCTITSFDRVLIVDLLRKNFMRLTPGAEYYFHQKDSHVSEATPKYLRSLIISVSQQNRWRFFPGKSR